MTGDIRTITVPFHLDELLPRLRWPAATGLVFTPELPEGSTWERLAALYEPVAAQVAEDAARGPLLVLSGDCTTSLGTVAGLQRARGDRAEDLGIVWFDAHGDLQTPETTTSGYLGGMALRMLLGQGDPTVADRLALRPVEPSAVVLVDGRDLDPPEEDYLARTAVRHLTAAELAAQGASALPDRPLYLHIDLDVLDPADLPGLLFPSPNGPGPSEVADALRTVLRSGRVAAVGLGCTWRQDEQLPPAARDIADVLVGGLGSAA